MSSPVEPVFVPEGGNVTDTERMKAGLSRRLSQALKCHLTGKPLQDPVVGLDGHTYEKAVIEKETLNTMLYPNRAIKSVLQKYHERNKSRRSSQQDSHRGSKSLRDAWQSSQLSSRSLFPFKQQPSQQIPDVFFCPITMQLMTRPVIDPSGHSYEYGAIVAWIRQHQSSPVTRQSLAENDLRDNWALAQLMEDELGDALEQEGRAVSSVRLWQERRQKAKEQQQEQALSTNQDIPMTLEEWERRAQQQRDETVECTSEDCLGCLVLLVLPILIVYFVIMLILFVFTFCFCPSCLDNPYCCCGQFASEDGNDWTWDGGDIDPAPPGGYFLGVSTATNGTTTRPNHESTTPTISHGQQMERPSNPNVHENDHMNQGDDVDIVYNP